MRVAGARGQIGAQITARALVELVALSYPWGSPSVRCRAESELKTWRTVRIGCTHKFGHDLVRRRFDVADNGKRKCEQVEKFDRYGGTESLDLAI